MRRGLCISLALALAGCGGDPRLSKARKVEAWRKTLDARLKALKPPEIACAHDEYVRAAHMSWARFEDVAARVGSGKPTPAGASRELAMPTRAEADAESHAILAFRRKSYFILEGYATGWTGSPPKPPGC